MAKKKKPAKKAAKAKRKPAKKKRPAKRARAKKGDAYLLTIKGRVALLDFDLPDGTNVKLARGMHERLTVTLTGAQASALRKKHVEHLRVQRVLTPQHTLIRSLAGANEKRKPYTIVLNDPASGATVQIPNADKVQILSRRAPVANVMLSKAQLAITRASVGHAVKIRSA